MRFVMSAVMSAVMSGVADPARRAKQRAKAQSARIKAGERHRVEYFHQADGPYSQLASQILDTFKQRYDIDLVVHPIRAPRGAAQPEAQQLAAWAARDAGRIAPYYSLVPPSQWPAPADPYSDTLPDAATLDAGSARLARLGHYSGAMFYYTGELYWGVDRLIYLEQRLRDLGACREPAAAFICQRHRRARSRA